MQSKPLGKKLERNVAVNVISLLAGLVFFFFQLPFYGEVCLVCLVIVIVTACRILGILMDANFVRYGLFGYNRHPDPLYRHDPGDPDYEEEKALEDFYGDDPKDSGD